MKKHIVKRHGHNEAFDERKLYASIVNACLATRMTDQEAELIADNVTNHVKQWLEPKHEVTSHDIKRATVRHFEAYNPDAAHLYEHLRSLS